MQTKDIEKNKFESFKRRIKKAQSSFSCMGDMILQLEIDIMPNDERISLKNALLALKVPVSYKYLNERIY